MDKHTIVHRDQQRYESSIRYIENSELSDVNKKLLLAFKDDLRRDGIGFKRIASFWINQEFSNGYNFIRIRDQSF